ncbi:MAG TPA: NAD(P)H-dependent oxidoreductase [Gemmatimonadota bacterium]|nr:NAD(P)H-dependent oxidoreductase [Gemmatimonadota bacterium]
MTAAGKERELRVAGFAGSLRTASFNRALLRAAKELAPADMKIEIVEIGGIPVFNADLEAEGDPEPVAAFKQAVGAADGLLIATPEYNLGVPGVTKNVIDWASRPPRGSVLDGKPVAVMGATPGMGGTARGQSQLRQAFVFTNSYAMAQPEVLVRKASELFDSEGRLTDEATREHLAKFLVAFGAWIRRLAGD